MPRPSRPPLFDHLNNIVKAYKLWGSPLCSVPQPPTTPPLWSTCLQTPQSTRTFFP